MSDDKKASESSSAGADSNGSAAPQATKTIQEGTITMHYPADQEATVFYNPVQVQNRDLSVLIISLYAERRAALIASRQFQHSLRQQQQEEQEKEPNNPPPNDGAEQPKKNGKQSSSDWKDKVAAFEADLDASQAVQDLFEKDTANGLCILDALAASGLRSLRYWKEIPGVHHVTINDLDSAAVERARTNLVANELGSFQIDSSTTNGSNEIGNDNIGSAGSKRRARGICIQTGDATAEMYNSRPTTKLRPGFVADDRSWDVIDLDPYGSAAPFLDSAIQSMANGGLICCTCTDMAALGGSRPETCVGRYGAMPIQRASYLQEMAIRILLQSMAVTAAKYGRTITPLLSVGIDFYVRVFVTVQDNKAGVNDLSLGLGYVHQSAQCQLFEIVPMGQMGGKNNKVYQPGRAPSSNCPETGASFKVGGPIWLGPLHDDKIIQAALDRLSGRNNKKQQPDMDHLATKDRLRGLLLSCRDELSDVPLFYRLPDISKTLHVSTPTMQSIRNALINAGYRVSAYHKDPQAVKTNAPNQVVWDVMRAHYRELREKNPKSTKPPKEGSTEAKILSRPIETKVDFGKPKPSAVSQSSSLADEEHVARFPVNPQSHWGPKKAATGSKRKAEDQQPKVE